MTENQLDLRQLLLMIEQQKDIDANFCLDHGCVLNTDDPRPLIKAINYILNYLNEHTEATIEVGLSQLTDQFRLSFMAITDHGNLPAESEKLAEAFSAYGAEVQRDFQAGKYVQFTVNFNSA